MINILGKTLALVHVGLSMMLLGLAGALLVNAVDFGWKEPHRLFSDPPNKKEENVLVPSDLDKAEAAMRKMVRFRDEGLYQLGLAQQKLARTEPWLGKNAVKGIDILDRLENGVKDDNGKYNLEKTFNIGELQFDDRGYLVLDKDAPGDLGFVDLADVKAENRVNLSYAGYMAQLRGVVADIDKAQSDLKDVLDKEETITKRLGGDLEPDGTPRRHPDGSIVRPGWYYLHELEMEAQRQLKRELDYLQPLWVKELVDAQLVVARRDLLLQRLDELGATGKFLPQSEWRKKQ